MSLFRDIADLVQAYKNYDPAAKSRAEILLLYPGPKALLCHRIASWLYKMDQFFLGRLFCEIGDGARLDAGKKPGSLRAPRLLRSRHRRGGDDE